MTVEQDTVACIKAEIAKLRGSQQDIVSAYANVFRTTVEHDPLAAIAFALVGAEMAKDACVMGVRLP